MKIKSFHSSLLNRKKKFCFSTQATPNSWDELQTLNMHKLEEIVNYEKEQKTIEFLKEKNQTHQDDLNKVIKHYQMYNQYTTMKLSKKKQLSCRSTKQKIKDIHELEKISSENLSEQVYQYDVYNLLKNEYQKSLELIKELRDISENISREQLLNNNKCLFVCFMGNDY